MVQIAPDRLPALPRTDGPERDAAAQQLRDLLVRVALAYLARQQYPVEAFGADTYLSIAEDYAQEAIAVILLRLETYRGESRFTTWAYSIVINLIADEMRRRCWRRRPLPADPDAALGRGEVTALRNTKPCVNWSRSTRPAVSPPSPPNSTRVTDDTLPTPAA